MRATPLASTHATPPVIRTASPLQRATGPACTRAPRATSWPARPPTLSPKDELARRDGALTTAAVPKTATRSVMETIRFMADSLRPEPERRLGMGLELPQEIVLTFLSGTCKAALVLRTDDPAMTSTGLVNQRDRGRAQRSVPALRQGEYLAIEDGEDIVILPLTTLVLRIGRSLAAGLTLDDATVSRRHAVLLRDDTGSRVLDDRSLNGTWVNDERVTEAMLCDGDVIELGRVRLHYLRRA
jgi:hypothetical protein